MLGISIPIKINVTLTIGIHMRIKVTLMSISKVINITLAMSIPGLGSSTVDQVLKYTKYPKYIPSTSTGQVLIFLKST